MPARPHRILGSIPKKIVRRYSGGLRTSELVGLKKPSVPFVASVISSQLCKKGHDDAIRGLQVGALLMVSFCQCVAFGQKEPGEC